MFFVRWCLSRSTNSNWFERKHVAVIHAVGIFFSSTLSTFVYFACQCGDDEGDNKRERKKCGCVSVSVCRFVYVFSAHRLSPYVWTKEKKKKAIVTERTKTPMENILCPTLKLHNEDVCIWCVATGLRTAASAGKCVLFFAVAFRFFTVCVHSEHPKRKMSLGVRKIDDETKKWKKRETNTSWTSHWTTSVWWEFELVPLRTRTCMRSRWVAVIIIILVAFQSSHGHRTMWIFG